MLEVLKYLNELQGIDLEIDKIAYAKEEEEKRLRVIENKISIEKKELQDIEKELLELEKNKRSSDGNLALEEERLKKSKTKINSVKNSEEHRALLQEIDERKRIVSAIEDENIGFIDKIEKKSKEKEKKSKEIEIAVKEYDKLSLTIQELDRDCNSKIEEQSKSKKEIEDKIAPIFRNKYKQLKNRNRGKAIVAVRNSVCQGCHMGIPPQIYNEIQKGEIIHFCPSCQRFLFYSELG